MVVWSGGPPALMIVAFIAFALVVTFMFLHVALRGPGGRVEPRGRGAGHLTAPPVIRWECGSVRCRAANPSYAKFCRMCGRPRM